MEILNKFIDFIKNNPRYDSHLSIEIGRDYTIQTTNLYSEIRVPNHELFFTYDHILGVLYMNYVLQDGSDEAYTLNCFGTFFSMYGGYNVKNKEIIYTKDISTEEALFQLSTLREVTVTVDDIKLLNRFISDVKSISKELYGIK